MTMACLLTVGSFRRFERCEHLLNELTCKRVHLREIR